MMFYLLLVQLGDSRHPCRLFTDRLTALMWAKRWQEAVPEAILKIFEFHNSRVVRCRFCDDNWVDRANGREDTEWTDDDDQWCAHDTATEVMYFRDGSEDYDPIVEGALVQGSNLTAGEMRLGLKDA
jgi:hypothetical protein